MQLGLRGVGWLESDVSDWIAKRVREARCSGNAPGAQERARPK
ncbi:MAG: hypothetical protein LT106_00825 [Burkholderiaceae bacterium]|nr:hypothetical protein [Burkholderiaceae bacterium]